MFETEILAASIRSPKHIVDAAESGADIVTCPLKAILGLLKHPLTDIGLAKFFNSYHSSSSHPANPDFSIFLIIPFAALISRSPATIRVLLDVCRWSPISLLLKAPLVFLSNAMVIFI